MLRPCLGCGDLTEGRRCEECSPPPSALRSSPRLRGYDSQWDRLSRRARQLQPFCSDCGTEDNLTADHLPEAWRRKSRGLSIRLCDIEVVCNDCNVKRGSSRPDSDRASEGAVNLGGLP